MHCYLRYFSVYLKSVLRYRFLILDTYPDSIYVDMNVRILGYTEPKEIREQKRLENHEPKRKI